VIYKGKVNKMVKKIIIIILVILAALIAGGLYYLNHVYIPKNLKPLVISTLQKALDKKVTIQEASYFPFRGVLFSKVNITGHDGTPFLKVEKVDLSLKSLPSLKGDMICANTKLVVKGIAFEQDKLKVTGGSIIDLNIKGNIKKKPSLEAVLELDNLKVKGLAPVSDITHMGGKVIFSQDAFSSTDLGAQIGKQKLDLVLSGKYDQNNLNLEKLEIIYGKTHIVVSVQVTDFNNPEIKLTSDGALNLTDIAKIASGVTLPKLEGVCKLKAEVSGNPVDLKTLSANLNVTSTQLSVDKIKVDNIDATVALKNGIADLNPFSCIFYEGNIIGSGNADITKPALPCEFSVDVKNINIAPLVKDLTEYDIGHGKVDAQLGISGPAADLNALAGDGWFKMTEAKIQMPSKFGGLTKMFQLDQLSQMLISEASATFTIKEGKVDTQDLKIIADIAEFMAKGYVTFTQAIDCVIEMDLEPELKEKLGVIGALVRKVRVHGQLPDKTKTDILMQDAIKEVVKETIKEKGGEVLKGFLGGGDKQGGTEQKTDFQDQIKKGLKGLFR